MLRDRWVVVQGEMILHAFRAAGIRIFDFDLAGPQEMGRMSANASPLRCARRPAPCDNLLFDLFHAASAAQATCQDKCYRPGVYVVGFSLNGSKAVMALSQN